MIEKFHGVHLDIPIISAAIDNGMTDTGYIVPNLGDVGDRMYGAR